jgi:uncharacterized protein (TIGR02147 family)
MFEFHEDNGVMKDIFSYRDYRQALREYYKHEKLATGATYARFAKKAGLSSPNYLKLVMEGKRRLTTANIQAFAKAMDFNGIEIDYFEALVLENQAETPLEKRYYSRRIRSIQSTSRKNHFARKAPTQLIDGAIKTAILICSEGKSREQAIAAAALELDLAVDRIESTLNTLIGAGEMNQTPEGLLTVASRHTMMTDPKGTSLSLLKFLQDGLDGSQTVFRARYPRGAAKFLSLLFTAEPGSLPGLFAQLREAFESTVEKHDVEPGQEAAVYRAQLQVYRLKKNIE